MHLVFEVDELVKEMEIAMQRLMIQLTKEWKEWNERGGESTKFYL